MLIMILELLAVGFILGLCITAVVLAVVSGAEAVLRVRRARPTAVRAAVHPLTSRPALAPRAGRSSPGHSRAA